MFVVEIRNVLCFGVLVFTILFFFVSGKFDSVGIATATLDDSTGKVRALRLHVHAESNNWAILSEVR